MAPGRNFVGVSFLEVTSHSIFSAEPGRNLLGHPERFVRPRRTLGKPDRNDGVLRSAMGVLAGPFWERKVGLRRALMRCFAKLLMCVLAPVRIFSVVCFLGVTTNSVCGAVPVRSGLDHLQIWAEISESCDGFKLGIAQQIPRIVRRRLLARDADTRRSAGTSGAQTARIDGAGSESGVVTASIPRRVADKLGAPPFRSDCASQNFSIIVTKKRSTRFYEIQGPVCVDGLVLQLSPFGHETKRDRNEVLTIRTKSSFGESSKYSVFIKMIFYCIAI